MARTSDYYENNCYWEITQWIYRIGVWSVCTALHLLQSIVSFKSHKKVIYRTRYRADGLVDCRKDRAFPLWEHTIILYICTFYQRVNTFETCKTCILKGSVNPQVNKYIPYSWSPSGWFVHLNKSFGKSNVLAIV